MNVPTWYMSAVFPLHGRWASLSQLQLSATDQPGCECVTWSIQLQRRAAKVTSTFLKNSEIFTLEFTQQKSAVPFHCCKHSLLFADNEKTPVLGRNVDVGCYLWLKHYSSGSVSHVTFRYLTLRTLKCTEQFSSSFMNMQVFPPQHVASLNIFMAS